MKILTYTVVTLVFVLAYPKGPKSNEDLRKAIDQFPLSEKRVEVSLSENGSIDDTLYVEYMKRDPENHVVYRQKFFPDNSETFSYYHTNGELFYLRKSVNGIPQSIYEAFIKKDQDIASTRFITFSSSGTDTLEMQYNYEFASDGKKRKMSIISEVGADQSTYSEHFNTQEKCKRSYLVMNRDTIENSKYFYEAGKLVRQIDWKNRNSMVSVIEFDQLEKEVNRRVFLVSNDSLYLVKTYDYINDKDGNPEQIVVNDLTNETIEMRRVITASL